MPPLPPPLPPKGIPCRPHTYCVGYTTLQQEMHHCIDQSMQLIAARVQMDSPVVKREQLDKVRKSIVSMGAFVNPGRKKWMFSCRSIDVTDTLQKLHMLNIAIGKFCMLYADDVFRDQLREHVIAMTHVIGKRAMRRHVSILARIRV